MSVLPTFRLFVQDALGLDTSTRQGILSFFDAVDGVPLSPDDAALFERFTGRPYTHHRDGYQQGVLQVGRQAGKSEGAAARLVYKATAAVLAGRRGRIFVGVAQDHRSGIRALLSHAKRFVDVPLVRPLVTKVTTDTIELEGGTNIYILPCRPAAVRGLEVDEAVLDELAFFLSTDAIPRDRDVWRAVLPALAMTSGRLIALSSPHAASGLLFDLHRQHYGNTESDLLFWRASSRDMNPALPERFEAHLRDVDPESARAELDAEFLSNVATLFDPASLDACAEPGVRSRPPQPNVSYRMFVDAASGTGKDGFAAAVAHGEGDRAVLDALVIIKPPFSPESAIAQVCGVAREYRCSEVEGDRYAPGFVTEAFARQRVRYRPSERDRSALYLDLLPRVNAAQVRLLDHPDLLRELRGLERRRGATKDVVDHRRGAHDDAANAAAGALTSVTAAQQVASMFHAFTGRPIDPRQFDPIAQLFGFEGDPFLQGDPLLGPGKW